jgi:hypothetical protein
LAEFFGDPSGLGLGWLKYELGNLHPVIETAARGMPVWHCRKVNAPVIYGRDISLLTSVIKYKDGLWIVSVSRLHRTSSNGGIDVEPNHYYALGKDERLS